MKPKTDLIVNSACYILMSLMVGIIVAIAAVTVLNIGIWVIATVSGLVASIFFDVNYASITSRVAFLEKLELWVILGGGPLGGLIWSWSLIKEKWERYRNTGEGWRE